LFSIQLSLKVAALSTVFVALAATPLAWALARRAFPGKALVETVATLPLVLPPTVTGFYLIVLLGRNGFLGKPLFEATGLSIMFTWQAAVIAAAVVSFPLMLRPARAAIEAVDREYERVASTLGLNAIQTALKVTLPLAWKGLLAGIVLAFSRALGEFGATMMLAGSIPGRTNTLTLDIYRAFQVGDDARANVAALILTGLSFGVVFLSERLGHGVRR
jgi:molybdate transport system permease protein